MQTVQIFLSEHSPQLFINFWHEVHLPKSKVDPGLQARQDTFEEQELQL